MRISTGSGLIDSFLEGGYETGIITSICGPGGSGKTTLCILAAVEASERNKKIIYIDTEGGFSVERLKQISPDYEKILENIIFLKPTSFKEQKNTFLKLRKIVNEKIGLIIVDTISMFYRLELGKDTTYEANRELGRQLCYLT
ncbi:AAA family ATPase, partial [Candidatus Woesearchaeota archaeon]|nr:AAA family ATPase [Candidatus Woesearchaeota archaeon]